MSRRNILCLSFIAFFLSFFFACKKNHVNKSDSAIYIAGVNGDTAIFWKNGVAENLSNGVAHAEANQLTVAGGAVYISGEGLNSGADQAVYWKDGLPNFLPVPADFTNISVANSVFVSGSDVYVAGWTSGNNFYATLWKNGIATVIDSTNVGEPYSIAVSGGSVYMCGTSLLNLGIVTATWWKDGVRQTLSNVVSEAYSICVSGSDVYIVGMHVSGISGVAALWKNGQLTDLSSTEGVAYSVTVAGNNVYVAGYETVNGIAIATIWKNGSPQHMPGGAQGSIGRSVFVSGSDVFMAGYTDNNNTQQACYWKNGQLVTIGNNGSEAMSIFAQ